MICLIYLPVHFVAHQLRQVKRRWFAQNVNFHFTNNAGKTIVGALPTGSYNKNYFVNCFIITTYVNVTKLQDFHSIHVHVNALMNFFIHHFFLFLTIVSMLYFFCNYVTFYLNRDIYTIFIGVCGDFEGYIIGYKWVTKFAIECNSAHVAQITV